jgi:hypothetical protein
MAFFSLAGFLASCSLASPSSLCPVEGKLITAEPSLPTPAAPMGSAPSEKSEKLSLSLPAPSYCSSGSGSGAPAFFAFFLDLRCHISSPAAGATPTGRCPTETDQQWQSVKERRDRRFARGAE